MRYMSNVNQETMKLDDKTLAKEVECGRIPDSDDEDEDDDFKWSNIKTLQDFELWLDTVEKDLKK